MRALRCCLVGCRLPWMRCDCCDCDGCSPKEAQAAVTAVTLTAAHHEAVDISAPGPPPAGGRPGHGPPPAPTLPPAGGVSSGPRCGTLPQWRAARIRRPTLGQWPFAPALCSCIALTRKSPPLWGRATGPAKSGRVRVVPAALLLVLLWVCGGIRRPDRPEWPGRPFR